MQDKTKSPRAKGGGGTKTKNKTELESAKKLIISAEASLKQARELLNKALGIKEPNYQKEAGKIAINPEGKEIFGVFDGENMVTQIGKKYPIPANYSSKSKLVSGDKLKLIIVPDGSFIYKQIGPVKRKKITGDLKIKKNNFTVSANGESYRVLSASATYFKAKEGNRLSIAIPEKEKSKWAAVEGILPEEK